MRYTAVTGSFPADKDTEFRSHLDGVFAAVGGAGGPVFSWATAGSSSGNITVRLDPADECLQPDYAACTRWWRNGSTITRVELIFADPDYALDQPLTMHMMGTAIGMDEWNHDGAVMNPSWPRPSGFHELERNAIHMMYQHRIAGNLLPDRDPGFTSAAGSRGVEVEQERRNR